MKKRSWLIIAIAYNLIFLTTLGCLVVGAL